MYYNHLQEHHDRVERSLLANQRRQQVESIEPVVQQHHARLSDAVAALVRAWRRHPVR